MRALIDYSKRILKLDLPDRQLAIKYAVPSISREAKRPSLLGFTPAALDPRQANFYDNLRQLQKQLRHLNHCNIGAFARTSFTRKILDVFYPAARSAVMEYVKEGGVPDPEARQATLDLVAEITSRCIDSYKLVFKALYLRSNLRLALARKDLQLSAFRILELTLFKQKVRALRYQDLSGAAWLAVNNVYHAMRSLNKSEEAVPGLDDAGARTLTNLFVALQIGAKFDLLRWPTAWQSFIEHYSSSADPGVDIKPDGGEKQLSWNVSISYAYDSGPSRNARLPDEASLGPSVLVDCEELKHVIVNDTRMFELAKRRHEKIQISSKFAMLNFTEVMAIVKLQMEIFRDEQPAGSGARSEWKATDMRMYIGFWSVYDLLDSIFSPRHRDQVGNRLADELARRSAFLAEDHVATHASLWSVQTRGEQSVILKTQETQFTTKMKIGSLIGFGVGDEGIKRPGIGVIARILRPSAKTVVVELEKFGKTALPVMVTEELACSKIDRNDKSTIHAVLVQLDAGKSNLLVPAGCGLGERAELLMQSQSKLHKIVLGKIEQVTKDFSSFPLS